MNEHTQKTPTPEEMARAYRECLEREKDRERHTRHTKQGAFEASMVRYDAFETQDKLAILKRAYRLSDAIASPARQRALVSHFDRKLEAARSRLRRLGLEYLYPTLVLIVKNGREGREKTICALAREIANMRCKDTRDTSRNSATHGTSKPTKKRAV